MQPRSRKPLTNVSNSIPHNNVKSVNSVDNAYNKANPNANKKPSKSFLIKTPDNLSNPFKHSLNITPTPLLSKPPKRCKADSDEDDDLKKPLRFTTKSASHPSSPHKHPNASNTSLPHTPKPSRHILIPKPAKINTNSNTNSHSNSHSNSPSVTISTSQSTSMSPSPGVIKNKQNVPSPQRIPTISLRSFHTVNHVEFYKPIPISQSRSTQFEIVNETYDDKSIQIKKKNRVRHNNYISCIAISPTAIEIKRYQRCIITVTCKPMNAIRIKEVINIEWDLHSIEVHIHAVGFNKRIRNRGNKERGCRKRSLLNMRKEDNDKCDSVQSSLDSSLQNSARLRRRRKSRRPMLSPTIRREKSFTAAPFQSPAPNKTRRNFVFNCNENVDELSVVNEDLNDTTASFTPKEFKKRRLTSIENQKRQKILFEKESQNKEIQQFQQLCIAVKPIQALFRCYLAQKRCKQLLQCKKLQQTHVRRQQYYIGVIKSQLVTKRVRKMYLNYKNAAIIIQSTIKTYCVEKKYNQHINELQRIKQQKQESERLERERIRKERQELVRKEREEQIRLKRERDEMLSQYIMSVINCKRTRRHYLDIRSSAMLLQNVFKSYFAQKCYHQKRNGVILIQTYIRGTLYRYKYLNTLQQIKIRQEQQQNNAAMYIQSWFKGTLHRRKYIQYMQYQQKKQCVLGVLSLWRLNQFRDMVNDKKRYIAMTHNAATYIQSWFKGAMYRRNYVEYMQREKENNAAVYIQTWFKAVMYRRKYIEYVKYQQKKQCVLGVLSLWRLNQFRDVVMEKRRYIAMQNNAAVYIQSWFKGVMYRRSYIEYKRRQQQNNAAVCIQSWFKGAMYRRKYVEYMTYQQKKQCVLEMLSLWRLNQFRNMVNEKRKYIAMRNNAVIYIQSWFKGVMYRRHYLEYKQQQQLGYVNKIIKIQALARGKLSRMEYYKNAPDLKQIINNLNVAHSKWKKENTVNYLLDSALNKLTKSRTLYGVSESCDTLENLLKIVPNISNRIVEHNIIGSLYNILRNCNRSLPHLNLVNKILRFFLFFAKYDMNCYKAIFYRNDTLDILSERLQIHRLDFVLFEITTKLFFIGVDIDIPNQNNKFLINLRKSDVNKQIRVVQKIMCSKLEVLKRVNKPLRKINNANVKSKKKFQDETTLAKCVKNINKLVDKL